MQGEVERGISLSGSRCECSVVYTPFRSALNVCHWHTAVFAPLRSALTVCHWHTAVFAPLRSALTVCHWHTAPSRDSRRLNCYSPSCRQPVCFFRRYSGQGNCSLRKSAEETPLYRMPATLTMFFKNFLSSC